tara:strand:- start:103 stop:996 length:894 start_codon:yes stop_codon:yes gene_type:complete
MKVNLSHPKYATRWLKTLSPHPEYGLLFKRSKFYPQNYLGFSFKTNHHGLRSNGSPASNNVIVGTSFAAGVGVNEGENWYQLDESLLDCFNVGMPVGLSNHLSRIRDIYDGNYENCIFLYHPNHLITSKIFYDSRISGKNIFDHMKWRIKFHEYLLLRLKHPLKTLSKTMTGRLVYDSNYLLDKNYCYFDLSSDEEFIKKEISTFADIFRNFKKIFFIRIPIKEELSDLKNLSSLRKNILENYKFIKSNLDPRIVHYDFTRDFKLHHYHEMDNHWNKEGNLYFNHLLKKKVYPKMNF